MEIKDNKVTGAVDFYKNLTNKELTISFKVKCYNLLNLIANQLLCVFAVVVVVVFLLNTLITVFNTGVEEEKYINTYLLSQSLGVL